MATPLGDRGALDAERWLAARLVVSPRALGSKLPWRWLILGAFALLVLVIVLARFGLIAVGWDLARTWSRRLMAIIRDAGPVIFFIAMAILPGLGAPMLAFLLPVGSAFGEKLGMPLVTGFCVLATVINMILTYVLARRALRPWLFRILTRFGYKLPEVRGADSKSLIIILRVTPGVPSFVQNYLLGLAEVPFLTYLWVSCVLSVPQTVGFVLFGDALQHGRGKMITAAVGILIAAALGMRLLRKRYSAQKISRAPHGPAG